MKYKIVTNGVSIETDFPSFAENIEIGSEIYEISDKEVFIGIITKNSIISVATTLLHHTHQRIEKSEIGWQKNNKDFDRGFLIGADTYTLNSLSLIKINRWVLNESNLSISDWNFIENIEKSFVSQYYQISNFLFERLNEIISDYYLSPLLTEFRDARSQAHQIDNSYRYYGAFADVEEDLDLSGFTGRTFKIGMSDSHAVSFYKEVYSYYAKKIIRSYKNSPEKLLIDFLKSECETLDDYFEEKRDKVIEYNKVIYAARFQAGEEVRRTSHDKFVMEFQVYKKLSLNRNLVSFIIGVPIALFVLSSWMFPLGFFDVMDKKINLILFLCSAASPFFWLYIGTLLHETLLNIFTGREPIEPIKPIPSKCERLIQ